MKVCLMCQQLLDPDVDGVRVAVVELELDDGRVAKMEMDTEEEVYVHTKRCMAKLNEIFRCQYEKWEEARVGNARKN